MKINALDKNQKKIQTRSGSRIPEILMVILSIGLAASIFINLSNKTIEDTPEATTMVAIRLMIVFIFLSIFLLSLLVKWVKDNLADYMLYIRVLLLVFVVINSINDETYPWIYLAIAFVFIANNYKSIRRTDKINDVLARESDPFYNKVFNTIRESIILLNPENLNIIFNNLNADKVFDFANRKTILCRDIMTSDSYSAFEVAVRKIYEYKGIWEGELTMIDASGKEFVGSVGMSYIEENNTEMIFMKIIDITQTKLAEEKVKSSVKSLQEKNAELENAKTAIMNVLEDINIEKSKVADREQRLEAIIESIAEGVVVIENDKNIFMSNTTILKMLGYKENEFDNQPYANVLHIIDEKTGELDKDFIDNVFRTGEVLSRFNKSQIVTKDGRKIDISETVSPIKDASGKVHRLVVVIKDVTEQRKVEKMRSEFVSIASHQLRAPLTAISWYIEMLMDEKSNTNLTDEQKSYISMVSEGNRKMTLLVNDLLDISRLEGGKELQFIKADSDIIEVVKDVIEEQKSLSTQKKQNLIVTQNPEGPIIINIDKDKIRQVIVNLVNNAIKYTPEGGEISIYTEFKDGFVRINIKDNGIGIPKDQQARIFEKFFRSDNAVSIQAQGSGLGLYVAKEVVEKHGGRIEFQSEVGNGTTFTVVLPR